MIFNNCESHQEITNIFIQNIEEIYIDPDILFSHYTLKQFSEFQNLIVNVKKKNTYIKFELFELILLKKLISDIYGLIRKLHISKSEI